MQLFSDETLAKHGLTQEDLEPDTLTHAGVKGMKWGHHKSGVKYTAEKRAKMNASADRGDALVKKHLGRSGRAVGMTVAKTAGVIALSRVGATVVGNISGSPAVAKGAAVVSSLVEIGALAVGIKSLVEINRSTRRSEDQY